MQNSNEMRIEQTILAYVLGDSEELRNRVAININIGHFTHPRLREIYQATQNLMDKGYKPDAITTYNELKATGSEIEITQILDIYENLPVGKNVDYYIGKMFESNELALFEDYCLESIQQLQMGEIDVRQYLSQRQEAFFKLSLVSKSISIQSSKELVEKTIDELDNEDTAIKTKFPRLDRLTLGLQQGYLIVVAGRPSVGKTAFMLSMVENISIRQNIPGLFISMEMGTTQLVKRMLASQADVDAYRIKRNKLEGDEVTRFSLATGTIADAPMYFIDAPTLTVPQISNLSRQAVKQFGVKYIMLDYLQLISGEGKTRNEEVERTVIGLKSIARELEVPFVLASQLSRLGDDKIPQLSHLRDSGGIEQAADQVYFIHREKSDIGVYQNEGDLIVAKARNESVGSIPMVFFANRTRWEERA